MARRGKTGLAEIVLWDFVLAGAAAFTVFLDARLAAEPTPRPKEPAPSPAASASPEPSASEAPGPTRAPSPTTSAAARALERLRADVRGMDPAAALEHYRSAPAKVRASREWRAFWPGEEGRLLAAQREQALARCLARELEVAADLGAESRVQELLALLPALERDARAHETSWAQARARRKGAQAPSEGLELSGYSPDQGKAEGKRCVVTCWLGQAEAERLRGAAEGALVSLEEALGRRLVKPCSLAVLKDRSGEPPADAEVVTRARASEEPEARAERVAWLALDWGAEQLLPGSRRWTRSALVRYLAASEPGAGGRRLNALGRAQAQLCTPPDGSGHTLTRLAERGPNAVADPTWARAIGLVRFAHAEQHAAAIELWPALLADARGRATLGVWITPARAAGIEAAWRKHYEAQQ